MAIGLSQLVAVPDSKRQMRSEAETNQLAVQKWQDGLSEVQRQIDVSQADSVLVVVDRGVDLEPTVALLAEINRYDPEVKAFVSPGPNLDTGSGARSIISSLAQNELTNMKGNPDVCIFLNAEFTEVLGCSAQNSVPVFAREM